MKTKFAIGTVILGAGLAVLTSAGTYGNAQIVAARTPAAASQEPDNTSTNKQETRPGSATADQQKETPADRDLAKKIRKSIVDDSSLSTSAHNVKIIVRDGRVVLKGPVQSEDEKMRIGAKAVEIAGVGKVKNYLTVKS
ncbi:MAG TPA: BON domain-containing protein [Candidatus Eisenbacteria bacterium]|nr:BON domain-containing protein [Candidatus Eisenbacteria bacterium]